jgi:hypothetical protein
VWRLILNLSQLIIENHPTEYTGYPFVTLIQYRKDQLLTVIDDVDENVIKAYVLDLCGPEGVDEERFLDVVVDWYSDNKSYPVSFEFSRRGLTPDFEKIYRTFNVEFVSRVIGPIQRFNMNKVQSLKKRRKKAIPPNVQIIVK